jgi:hypothetical protein
VIVFSFFRGVLQTVANGLGDAVIGTITGSVPPRRGLQTRNRARRSRVSDRERERRTEHTDLALEGVAVPRAVQPLVAIETLVVRDPDDRLVGAWYPVVGRLRRDLMEQQDRQGEYHDQTEDQVQVFLCLHFVRGFGSSDGSVC